jgi:hypothetical protein
MMDVAVRDGQHDVSTIQGSQFARAGALDRASLRDSDQTQSDQKRLERF